MTAQMTIITGVAWLVGYGVGRLRPWRRLGDWAQDQVRFAGSWARGGTIRQAVLVLVHVITAPRTSWRTPTDRPPNRSTRPNATRTGAPTGARKTREEQHEHRAARRVRGRAGPHQPAPK
ncbi:hypothetical protein GCM10010390_92950 [Streptomyces mordarskii]|uniref:Transposase n=1 Tax=Streptomyces mordarskii TaxID=1226758 RepID=A0ABN1EV94_9ACTN